MGHFITLYNADAYELMAHLKQGLSPLALEISNNPELSGVFDVAAAYASLRARTMPCFRNIQH